MIRVTLPSGEKKNFAGYYTVEKNDEGRSIRILDGTKPIFVIPAGSRVTIAENTDDPHPRIEP